MCGFMRLFHLSFLMLMLAFNISFLNLALSEVREGKAVYEISGEKGMRLTAAALKNIEVSTKKINAKPPDSIPLSGLVQFQNRFGVYRLRDGWFKLIPVKINRKDKSEVSFVSAELDENDEIVITGVALLRVAEMDAFGGEE